MNPRSTQNSQSSRIIGITNCPSHQVRQFPVKSSIVSRYYLVRRSLLFRSFFAYSSFGPRSVFDRLTNNERETNEDLTRSEREVNENRTITGRVAIEQSCSLCCNQLGVLGIVYVNINDCFWLYDIWFFAKAPSCLRRHHFWYLQNIQHHTH